MTIIIPLFFHAWKKNLLMNKEGASYWIDCIYAVLYYFLVCNCRKFLLGSKKVGFLLMVKFLHDYGLVK